jgi:hypothetical protein
MQNKIFAYPNTSADLSENVSLRLLEDVERLSDDQDEGRDQHQRGRNAEGQRVAGVVVRVETGDILPEKHFY